MLHIFNNINALKFGFKNLALRRFQNFNPQYFGNVGTARPIEIVLSHA